MGSSSRIFASTSSSHFSHPLSLRRAVCPLLLLTSCAGFNLLCRLVRVQPLACNVDLLSKMVVLPIDPDAYHGEANGNEPRNIMGHSKTGRIVEETIRWLFRDAPTSALVLPLLAYPFSPHLLVHWQSNPRACFAPATVMAGQRKLGIGLVCIQSRVQALNHPCHWQGTAKCIQIGVQLKVKAARPVATGSRQASQDNSGVGKPAR